MAAIPSVPTGIDVVVGKTELVEELMRYPEFPLPERYVSIHACPGNAEMIPDLISRPM